MKKSTAIKNVKSTSKLVLAAPLEFFNDDFELDYEDTRIVFTDKLIQFYDNGRLPPEQRTQGKDISNNELFTMLVTKYYYIINGYVQKKAKMQAVNFGSAEIVFLVPQKIRDVEKETMEEKSVRALLSSNIMDAAHRLKVLYRLIMNPELFQNCRVLTVSELKENDGYVKPVVKLFAGKTVQEMEEVFSKMLGKPVDLFNVLCKSVFNVTFTYTHDRARLGAILIKANGGKPVTGIAKFNATMGSYAVGREIYKLLEAVKPNDDDLVDATVGKTALNKNDLSALKYSYNFLKGKKNDGNSQKIARYIVRTEEVEAIFDKLCEGDKENAFEDSGNIQKLEARKLGQALERYDNNTEYFDKLVELLLICQPISHILANYYAIEAHEGKRGAKPATHEATMMTIIYGLYLVSKCNLEIMKKNVNHVCKLLAENDKNIVNKFLKDIADLKVEYTDEELEVKAHTDIPKMAYDRHFVEKRNRYLGLAAPIISAFVKTPTKEERVEVFEF